VGAACARRLGMLLGGDRDQKRSAAARCCPLPGRRRAPHRAQGEGTERRQHVLMAAESGRDGSPGQLARASGRPWAPTRSSATYRQPSGPSAKPQGTIPCGGAGAAGQPCWPSRGPQPWPWKGPQPISRRSSGAAARSSGARPAAAAALHGPKALAPGAHFALGAGVVVGQAVCRHHLAAAVAAAAGPQRAAAAQLATSFLQVPEAHLQQGQGCLPGARGARRPRPRSRARACRGVGAEARCVRAARARPPHPHPPGRWRLPPGCSRTGSCRTPPAPRASPGPRPRR
jgi:hypothetical protein